MKEKGEVKIVTTSENRFLPGISASGELNDCLSRAEIVAEIGVKYIETVEEGEIEKVVRAAKLGMQIVEHAEAHGTMAIIDEEKPEANIYIRREDGNFHHKTTYYSPAIQKIEWEYIEYDDNDEDEQYPGDDT